MLDRQEKRGNTENKQPGKKLTRSTKKSFQMNRGTQSLSLPLSTNNSYSSLFFSSFISSLFVKVFRYITISLTAFSFLEFCPPSHWWIFFTLHFLDSSFFHFPHSISPGFSYYSLNRTISIYLSTTSFFQSLSSLYQWCLSPSSSYLSFHFPPSFHSCKRGVIESLSSSLLFSKLRVMHLKASRLHPAHRWVDADRGVRVVWEGKGDAGDGWRCVIVVVGGV